MVYWTYIPQHCPAGGRSGERTERQVPGMSRKGINQFDQRQQNSWLIKKHLYLNSPISRVEIAHSLGLTTPVISSTIAPLVAAGIVKEQESAAVETAKGAGRRPVLLTYNPEAYYACGVDLGPYYTNYVLTDLCGSVVVKLHTDRSMDTYERTIENLSEQIPAFLAACGIPREKLLGVGVAMPGLINGSEGMIYTTFKKGWTEFDPAAALEARLHIPVLVENNVRAKVIGAELIARMVTAQPFAYLSVFYGIACQMIIDDKVLYGKSAAAGEIGHMVVQRGGPVCPTCGSRGCLEAMAGERAILTRCREVMALEPGCLLWQLCPEPEALTIEQVLEAQAQGDLHVGDILYDALDYLGMALANVVNLLSPAMVVIDGRIFAPADNQAYLLRAAERSMFRVHSHQVQFRFLPYDPYRGAQAGAAVVIQQFLRGS